MLWWQSHHEGLYAGQAGPQVHRLLQPGAARLAGQLLQVVLHMQAARQQSKGGTSTTM